MTIEDDGTFKDSSNKTKILTYGGMLNLRALIVHQAHYYIGIMGTIAARYSFKRRQFDGRDGSEYPEALIIQY